MTKDIMQDLMDKIYSRQPISESEISFALGWATGIANENKRLRLENAELKSKIPQETEAKYGSINQ